MQFSFPFGILKCADYNESTYQKLKFGFGLFSIDAKVMLANGYDDKNISFALM